MKINFTTIILLALVGSLNVYGQTKVSGIIKGEGQTLPFCAIKVVGGTSGTTTDIDGKFELDGVFVTDTLDISYVGFLPQRILVGNQTSFTITLRPDIVGLEEVIVVGYGVQRKVNVTGSVVSVDQINIENRGVTNVSNVLAGQAPGVTVLQRGGSPGRNEGEIRIRGTGTLGFGENANEKNSPLIIVDGIETGSLTEINPNDIQNVSILKDAAAGAIYGVRAANGVIIITTKRGKEGKIRTNYSYQFGISDPVGLPEKVNSSELAELFNEAQKNEGLSTRFFSNDDLELFESGVSINTHANSNQVDEIFNRSGIRQVHNLSVAGGTETVLYNVSLGYTDEQGLMPSTGLKRYNFRTNLDLNLNERLTVGFNLAGSQRNILDPIVGVGGIIHRGFREWATDPLVTGNGNWAFPNFGLSQGINHNSVALVNDGGFKEFTDSRFTGTFFVEYKPWKPLSIKGIAATIQDFNKRKEITKSLPLYNVDESLNSITNSSILEGRDNVSDLNLQLLVNFSKEFGSHTVSTLLGMNSREIENTLGSFSALDLRSNGLDQINAADRTQDAVAGSATDYRLLSYFGRLNYVYDDKYLVEANFRYDGTSRFSESNRFQVFPSFSLGWRVSEEDFFNLDLIQDFKLRASWGRLGSQEIGEYRYINTYVFDQTAYIGNMEQGGSTERIPVGNPDIVWETTEVFNYGVDLSFLKGALTFSGDYFVRNTSDILLQKPLPAAFGSGTLSENFPFVNAASTRNQGFELNLDYTYRFGDLLVRTNLNFAKVSTEITDLAGTDQPGFSVGDPIANIYGYEALGIFQNQDEIDNHADQSALGPQSRPGDMKYEDFTGPDGVPDGVVNALDRKNLGSFFPSINYGFSVRLEYKGFDFSMLWQGVADVKSEIGGRQRQPFFLGSSPWKLHLDRATLNRDDEVENPEARYPRTLTTGNTKNYLTSSWWVESTQFLKLRNTQLGYNFPSAVLNKLKVERLRVYLSGENLLTLTDFEGFDPEVPTSGSVLPTFSGNSGYPVTRTFLVGLNLTF